MRFCCVEREQTPAGEASEGEAMTQTSTPPQRKEPLPTPLESAVLQRRVSTDPGKSEDEQEFEGEGFVSENAEKLIHQLYVSLGSIKSDNTSVKLKNQVHALLNKLHGNNTIDKKQKKKFLRII